MGGSGKNRSQNDMAGVGTTRRSRHENGGIARKTAEKYNKRATKRLQPFDEYAKGFRRLAESHAGGLDGDRTHDLLFRRQTLYPLSYKPMQRTTVHGLRPFATRFGEKRDADLAIVGKVSTRAQCIRVLGATSTRCTLST